MTPSGAALAIYPLWLRAGGGDGYCGNDRPGPAGAFARGKTIKEIARDLKISRNTVRKILRSEETSFSYDREVQPRPKLENWSAELDRLLTTNADKPARERLTLIRISKSCAGLVTKAAMMRCAAMPADGSVSIWR